MAAMKAQVTAATAMAVMAATMEQQP